MQGIPILYTLSNNYLFRTVEELPHKVKPNKRDIQNQFLRVERLYEARGLTVTQFDGDNEFSCLCEEIRPTFLNLVAAEEHVGNVERSIRIIK